MATITDGLIGQTFDATTSDGRPCIMGFVLGSKVKKWLALSEEERARTAREEYARVFESDEALDTDGYTEKNWLVEPLIGGSGGIAPTGVTTGFHHAIRKPVNRVHFSGTETATDWSGYMDGAIQSGWRAAKEILLKLNVSFMDPEKEMRKMKTPEIFHRTPYTCLSFLNEMSDVTFILFCVLAVAVALVALILPLCFWLIFAA